MTSQANEKASEESLAQKWELTKDEASGKYIVPDSNIDNLKINKEDRFPAMDFVQIRKHTKSDPNCNSVECMVRHSNPQDAVKEVEYKDTTDPIHLDEDIKDTNTHLGSAETKLGKWKWDNKRDDGMLNWMAPK